MTNKQSDIEGYYGHIDPKTIGLVMKEMVRRVILSIREHRLAFEVSEKKGLDGEWGDLVTNVDKEAQEIYVQMIKDHFPNFGILAEEEHLRVNPSKDFPSTYFTVDPLDGTKAFIRMQSHGIGTMIALVHEGLVVGAYVGDVMTEEVYGFSPGSEKVYRISDFGSAIEMKLNNSNPKDQYITLRSTPDNYSEDAVKIIKKFKNITVESGSIGTHASDLWKGVVGAMILEPGYQTPWDTTPVFGISRKLGLNFYKIENDSISKMDTLVSKETKKFDHEIIIASKDIEDIL